MLYSPPHWKIPCTKWLLGENKKFTSSLKLANFPGIPPEVSILPPHCLRQQHRQAQKRAHLFPFQLVHMFSSLLDRPLIKAEVSPYYSSLLATFSAELDAVKVLYDTQTTLARAGGGALPAHTNMPPVAGQLQWSLELQQRLEGPHRELFAINHPCVRLTPLRGLCVGPGRMQPGAPPAACCGSRRFVVTPQRLEQCRSRAGVQEVRGNDRAAAGLPGGDLQAVDERRGRGLPLQPGAAPDPQGPLQLPHQRELQQEGGCWHTAPARGALTVLRCVPW